jgi:hypothetical protein
MAVKYKYIKKHMRSIDYPTKDKELASDTKNATPGNLASGIVIERKRSDLLMFLIFLLFIGGMFGTAAYGYAKGDPKKLLTPFDSRGNQCGLVGTPTEKFKYIWWPDLY